MILRENVVYMADDESRDAALRALKSEIGTEPQRILDAPRSTLARISKTAGILAENNVKKVRRAAEIAVREFAGDVRRVLKLPADKAKKALKKFPGIGDPGAEKILLFNGRLPTLALNSNGLRVLTRLGFAAEGGPYAATYRTAQKAAQEGSPKDPAWLAKAHQLLRRHGQTTCKRTRPLCDACALNPWCPYPKRRPAK